MSELNGNLEDLQPAAVADPPAPVEAPAPGAPPAEPPEDDHPEAVADAAGQKYVPLPALKAVREELKTLKPLAERAQQLEAYVNDVRPYVEFLKNHPQLLQPQQPAQAPQAPQADPTLVELARTLELYDPQTGQPDVKRAEVIRNLTRQEAQAIAQSAIAPVQARTYEQQAASNLAAIVGTTDADGRPLEQRYVMDTVRTITASLPREEALRVLADANVANLITLTALGLQARSKKTGPAPPSAPPLHVESPGGGSQFVMSEDSRKLARLAGIPEQDYAERAKKFQPGRANVLE